MVSLRTYEEKCRVALLAVALGGRRAGRQWAPVAPWWRRFRGVAWKGARLTMICKSIKRSIERVDTALADVFDMDSNFCYTPKE